MTRLEKKFLGQRVFAKIGNATILGVVECVKADTRLLRVRPLDSCIGRWVDSRRCRITYTH